MKKYNKWWQNITKQSDRKKYIKLQNKKTTTKPQNFAVVKI